MKYTKTSFKIRKPKSCSTAIEIEESEVKYVIINFSSEKNLFLILSSFIEE